jgi:hypothetical protein
MTLKTSISPIVYDAGISEQEIDSVSPPASVPKVRDKHSSSSTST